ncbi:MAG: glycosyltransferase, partial [Candidatus Aminicenantes bacterium]|nr:glycosyltransferase [Candidatus Aminicenantes bacterium]
SEPHLLNHFNIKPREYFLQITRFEPENNPLLTIQAFNRLQTDKKLVLIGGAKYLSRYAKKILLTQDKRVILPGFIYDKNLLRELLTNCLAYIHGNEAGGTNPALLQAMGCGALVIARDVIFNREVLRHAGLYYEKKIDDLVEKMSWVINNEPYLESFRKRAQEIIASDYQWDHVVNRYEALLFQLALNK